MIGRKKPVYVGLSLFAAASIGCAVARNIETLIACRVLQGMGACEGMVVPRAVVRDLHTGRTAVRMMALLMLVFSISPILAPLFGSFIIAALGWRSIFWVVGGAAVAGLLLTGIALPETRGVEQRRGSSWSRAFADYRTLMMDRQFLGLGAIAGFAFASFFIYLANSSFVLMEHFGLTPARYSLFFSLNAAAFIGAAQLNSWLVGKYSLVDILRAASIGFALATTLLLIIFVFGVDRLSVMAVMLFIGYSFMGLIMPNATVLSLEQHGTMAGTASALLGAVQMVIASTLMAITSYFAQRIADADAGRYCGERALRNAGGGYRVTRQISNLLVRQRTPRRLRNALYMALSRQPRRPQSMVCNA